MNKSLTCIIYGQSKSGKSTLAASSPAPRLILDVESGARFLPIRPRVWDPMTEEPPAIGDGDEWDTAVVQVTNYDSVLRAYQWLQSGKHPFRSVIVDSISELQVKIIDKISNRGQMQMAQWGDVLRATTGLMRDLRDLTAHPTNPIQCIVLIAMEKDGPDGLKRPFLSGQAAVTLPYLFDITGYLRVEEYAHPEPSQPPYKVRRLYVTPTSFAVCGERVGGRLGDIVEQSDLTITTMIDKVYGEGTALNETNNTDVSSNKETA
jgi:AAA domain